MSLASCHPSFSPRQETPHRGLTVRRQKLRESSPAFLEGWRSLAERSATPNPFFDPDFLVPVVEEVDPAADVEVWSAACCDGRPKLVCAVQPVLASARFPFPHLEEYHSAYTFCGGLLVDPEYQEEALARFLAAVAEGPFRHGLLLKQVGLSATSFEQLLETAGRSGFQVTIQNETSRACLNLREFDSSDVALNCSKSRAKSLRRGRRRLGRSGAVSFRLLRSPEEALAAAERFLDLERRGWKSETGTAIGCRPADERFFVRMINALAARGMVLFGELLVGSRVVASTCNLLSGDRLYAFKIGWDVDFREGSPGLWAELELVRAVREQLPGVNIFDSCAGPGSYLEQFWPHRLTVGDMVFSRSRRAKLFQNVRETLRMTKRQLRL